MNRLKAIIPLGLFASLIVMMAIGLTRDPSELSSEMIDRSFPAFERESLFAAEEILTEDILMGKISLVNVFGSWCTACVYEHPKLVELSQKDDIQIIGINWRDKRERGQGWLAKHGNPYSAVIFDGDSLLAIDLGITGAPETFLVDAFGKIRYKHVGIITDDVWNEDFKPRLTQLSAGPS